MKKQNIDFKGLKLKNRRVFVGIGESEGEKAIYINIKRLIKKEEIALFKKNPTVRMTINKNIIISDLCLSFEAAESLFLLLGRTLKYQNLK